MGYKGTYGCGCHTSHCRSKQEGPGEKPSGVGGSGETVHLYVHVGNPVNEPPFLSEVSLLLTLSVCV